MEAFIEFVDKKNREAKKQLETIKKLLEKEGMKVKSFLEEEEPYLYLLNPGGGLSFDGVRIYKIGGTMAYRVQKEEKTHPYGKAYSLNVEDMFSDIITDDDMNERKAGEEIIKSIVQEFRIFFNKSTEADKENRADDLDRQRDTTNFAVSSSTGTDYSNMVQGNARTHSPL
jgi:hypothetical protein